MNTTPKLKKVIRLDNLPLDRTYYTEEGYLKDNPIVTRTGIFEYVNADGTISRELRLPEEVFDPESLGSYKGKPVIVTHDAGCIDKDNVHQEQIGTILSDGYKDGNKVRAEIIIHDTDVLKSCGLRELSLGYNLDLEYSSGEWNGQHYDAIQRNIRINHLALVQEARAGETARLNIDSRDKTTKKLKEDSSMKKNIKKTKKRSDGVLSPEQLALAIEEYKARRAQRLAAKADEEGAEEVVSVPPATDNEEATAPAAPVEVIDEDAPVEEKVEILKDRRDRRDSEGDPESTEEAMAVIANQDEDIDILFDIIDSLLAEKAFDEAEETPAATEENTDEDEETSTEENTDEDDTVEGEENTDEDEEELTEDEDEETAEENTDDDEEVLPTVDPKDGEKMNADSVDAIVRQRVQLGMVGRVLNMDGLETMKLASAKKAVIKAVRPGLRLDGKSKAYVNAAFDCAVADVMARSRKDTKYQKKQMFNGDSRKARKSGDSAMAARERMIKRQREKKEEI